MSEMREMRRALFVNTIACCTVTKQVENEAPAQKRFAVEVTRMSFGTGRDRIGREMSDKGAGKVK